MLAKDDGEMRQDDNTWSRPRLILATGTELSAQTVVEVYAERWGIEPLFHNLKRWWGGNEPVATIEGSAGTVDADSLYDLCLDAIACPETVGILSVDGNRALEQENHDHDGTFRFGQCLRI